MGALGEWLKEVLDGIFELWPIRILEPWKGALVLRRGKILKEYGSGGGWLWVDPVIGDVYEIELNRRTDRTATQRVITLDGVAISFSLGVKWRVVSVRLYYLNIQEARSTVLDEIMSEAARLIMETTFEEARAPGFGARVMEAAQAEMRGWGVEVLKCRFASFTNDPALHLLGGDPQALVGGEDEADDE